MLIRGGWQRSAQEMVSSKGCLPTTGWEPLKNSGRKEKKKGEKKKEEGGKEIEKEKITQLAAQTLPGEEAAG